MEMGKGDGGGKEKREWRKKSEHTHNWESNHCLSTGKEGIKKMEYKKFKKL